MTMGLNEVAYQWHLLQRYHVACDHEGSSHRFPIFHLTNFYRDAGSELSQFVNQSSMVEFYSLMFSRFPHYTAGVRG